VAAVVADAPSLPDLATVATPALVVDRAVLVENIDRMAARAESAGVALRPHVKTHKSVEVAALQRARGAAGLTVATLREAEVFVAAGFDDILIASPPIGGWRLDRLVELAGHARVRVVVDDATAVGLLDQACRRAGVAIGYLWEVDSGVGRFGTPPGKTTANLIAAVAESTSNSSFDGLLAFGGHVYAAANRADVAAAAREERAAVTETAAALADLGIETLIRSVGTTPTAHALDEADGITEIRPGNYVFYDATQVALGVVGSDSCALAVLATVVSRPSPNRAILDCGSKALAAERISAQSVGFGFVRDHPNLRVARLYEEQAIVVAEDPFDLPLGTRVEVVPNHACAAVNLHEQMLVTENRAVVDVWPVDARGWGA